MQSAQADFVVGRDGGYSGAVDEHSRILPHTMHCRERGRPEPEDPGEFPHPFAVAFTLRHARPSTLYGVTSKCT